MPHRSSRAHSLLSIACLAVLLLSPEKVTAQTDSKPTHAKQKSLAADSVALKQAIHEFLNRWHKAASKADAQIYLGSLDKDAIFLGTDSKERWSKDEFSRFTKKYFDQGKGWTYTARERHVYLSPENTTAWFDEKLENAKYGDVRGSGVLIKKPSGWKIVQYNLSFPIPNEIAKNVVQQIADLEKRDKATK